MDDKCKIQIIFIIQTLTGLLIITSNILLIIQSSINLTGPDIKEKFFEQQFSYEIYSSINSNLIIDLKIQDECEDNYKPLNFFLKLNSKYTSKYTVNIKKLFNYKFCIPNYEKLKDKYNSDGLKYEKLLRNSININDIKNYEKNDKNSFNNICKKGYKPCGILDTMNNILCLPKKYNCPLNDIIISKNKNLTLIDNGYNEITLNNSFFIYLNTEENIEKPIIITNFITFDKPWNHEYQNIIGKYKKGTEDIFDSYDKYMKIVPFLNFSNITLEDILKWEENNDYMKSVLNELNEEEKPNKYYFLFHKNYIGFKSYEELLKFKKIFKEDDYKKSLQFGKYIPFDATIVADIIVESEANNPTYTFTLKGPVNPITHKASTPPFEVKNMKLVTTQQMDDKEGKKTFTMTVKNNENGHELSRNFTINVVGTAGIITTTATNVGETSIYALDGHQLQTYQNFQTV